MAESSKAPTRDTEAQWMITHSRSGSPIKGLLHFVLAQIFEISPALAAALGRLVRACWSGFKGA
jgi:hypothetical protein